MPQKRTECFRLLFDHLAWIEHQFFNGIRHSRKAGNLWGMMRSVAGIRKSIHHSWLAKGLGLGFLYWGFKGFQEEIPSGRGQHSSNRVSGISSRTMHQSTTTSLSQTIWPRWASRPCSLNSGAVVKRQLRRWKRLWWRSLTRPPKRTSMGPSRSCWNGTTSAFQPEETTSKGTRISCVYYQ